MTALAVGPVADEDVEAVIALWERCGLIRPWNDPRADMALGRRGPSSTVLIGRDGGDIVASAMVGHDGHRGWFYYVSVDPERQSGGYGRAIMAAGEDWLRLRGIVKAQLLVRPDNKRVKAFYESIGYGEQPIVMMTHWLDGRDPPV